MVLDGAAAGREKRLSAGQLHWSNLHHRAPSFPRISGAPWGYIAVFGPAPRDITWFFHAVGNSAIDGCKIRSDFVQPSRSIVCESASVAQQTHVCVYTSSHRILVLGRQTCANTLADHTSWSCSPCQTLYQGRI